MKTKVKACDWEITTKCNLNCKHCIVEKNKQELNKNECFKIIDNLHKLGCGELNFTGGEPLIKKNIIDILKYSKLNGMKNRILTNGILVNKRNVKLLKKLVSYIGFSLEGLEKENDIMRGKNSFNKTIQAINLIKKEKIPFGIYITINKFNKKNFEEFLIFIKKLKPANISINQIVLRGNAKKNKQIKINIDEDKILRNIKRIFRKQRFKKETGCLIKKDKIFLNSRGKAYLCTEINQVNGSKWYADLLKMRFRKMESQKSLCPYFSFVSKNISLNLLTNEKCLHLK